MINDDDTELAGNTTYHLQMGICGDVSDRKATGGSVGHSLVWQKGQGGSRCLCGVVSSVCVINGGSDAPRLGLQRGAKPHSENPHPKDGTWLAPSICPEHVGG